jgi:hypothetical protein
MKDVQRACIGTLARDRSETSIATAATQVNFFPLKAPQPRELSGARVDSRRDRCNSREFALRFVCVGGSNKSVNSGSLVSGSRGDLGKVERVDQSWLRR